MRCFNGMPYGYQLQQLAGNFLCLHCIHGHHIGFAVLQTETNNAPQNKWDTKENARKEAA